MTKNASATAAGYTYQFQRALFRLVDTLNDESLVSIETFDDVTEIRTLPDGSVEAILEQDKHSIRDENNLQDANSNVWKTISNWLKQLNSLQASYTSLTFFFATNRIIPEDTIVRKMAAARSDEDCDKCIIRIKEIAALSEGDAKPYLSEVIGATHDDLRYLIRNLELFDAQTNAENLSTKSNTVQRFQLHSDLKPSSELIYQNLLGYIVDECQKNWLKKCQAWFSAQQIRNRLSNEISLRAIDKYLDREMLSTDFQSYVKNDTKDHLFLRQLVRIGLDEEQITDELDNYWAFYSERNRLVDEGEILPSHWEKRESQLHSRWKTINRDVKLSSNSWPSDDARGLELYKKTISPDYKESLAGHNTNHLYFTHGHYHHLANNSEQKHYVYWHVGFKPSSRK